MSTKSIIYLTTLLLIVYQFTVDATEQQTCTQVLISTEEVSNEKLLLCQLHESAVLLDHLVGMIVQNLERLMIAQDLTVKPAGDFKKRKHEYLRFGKRKHEYLRFGKK